MIWNKASNVKDGGIQVEKCILNGYEFWSNGGGGGGGDLDPTKIAIFPLHNTTFERLTDTPYNASNYSEFCDLTIATLKTYFGLNSLNYVEVIFGDLCGVTNSDIEIVYNSSYQPITPEPKLTTNICKLSLNEGITRLVSYDDRISFPSNDYSLKEIFIPSTVTLITANAGQGYDFFSSYLSNPSIITINKPQNSILYAPWGAANAQIVWLG